MPVIIGAIGLAASIGGGVMGSMGQAASAKAQARQQEINLKWQEFEKQMNLEIQRGQMGIAEMDRLYKNKRAIGGSQETMLAENRAAREQFQYATNQFSRNYRQNSAAITASTGSRGVGRGGTADALANQLRTNTSDDQLRMVTNLENQLDMFENKRNQQLGQINARSADKPPMYFPSTPIPEPNTSGMVLGSILGGLGAGIGGMAGAFSGAPSAAAPTTAPGGMPFSQVAALNLGG